MSKKQLLAVVLIFLRIWIFADQKGDEVAKKMYGLKEPADQYSRAVMYLVDSRKNKKLRKIEMFTKETDEGTDSFIKFLEPADVKGSTFLTNAHKIGNDEQRLYLPSLGKIRKISSSGKKGSFMGSDLNFYDMEDREYEDSNYRFIKKEDYKGMDCAVIEIIPNDEKAPYSKMLAWVNLKNYFTYKVECYDKKRDELSKTILMQQVNDYQGILIAERMVVENHLNDHMTILITENIRINKGLNNDIFTVQNLTR